MDLNPQNTNTQPNYDDVPQDDWPWPHYPQKAQRYYLPGGLKLTGWEGDFLANFRDTGIIRVACAYARVSYDTVTRTRKQDDQFRLAFEHAQVQAVETLEAAAWKRAVQGVTETTGIYHNGKLLERKVVTRYSDGLLKFLLTALAPQKYRETVEHNHNIEAALDHARKVARAEGLDEEQAVKETMRIINGAS